MNTVIELLQTPGGQAVLLALAGVITALAAKLGKHLGVTPAQVRETLDAAQQAGMVIHRGLSDPQVKALVKAVNGSLIRRLKGK